MATTASKTLIGEVAITASMGGKWPLSLDGNPIDFLAAKALPVEDRARLSMTMRVPATLQVSAPSTPGAEPSAIPATDMADAERIAETFAHRRDLVWQSVRIERLDGTLIKHA